MENSAEVLGRRAEYKDFTENEFIDTAKKWFYDNPKDSINQGSEKRIFNT